MYLIGQSSQVRSIRSFVQFNDRYRQMLALYNYVEVPTSLLDMPPVMVAFVKNQVCGMTWRTALAHRTGKNV